MNSLRSTLEGPLGKVIAVAIAAVGVVAVVVVWRSGGPSASDLSRGRTYMDAELGKPFTATLSMGMSLPLKSPFTGKATGVEAELCYWTADGTIKATPDPVLLNPFHIPPVSGPTFCPFCHRLVVMHNPVPSPGDPPPQSEQDYRAAHP